MSFRCWKACCAIVRMSILSVDTYKSADRCGRTPWPGPRLSTTSAGFCGMRPWSRFAAAAGVRGRADAYPRPAGGVAGAARMATEGRSYPMVKQELQQRLQGHGGGNRAGEDRSRPGIRLWQHVSSRITSLLPGLERAERLGQPLLGGCLPQERFSREEPCRRLYQRYVDVPRRRAGGSASLGSAVTAAIWWSPGRVHAGQGSSR